MSAASVRQIKESGGGGGKISSAPAAKVSPVPARSVSAGKENPRPTSRASASSQKPTLKPMARVAPAEESRARWFTSSVPRGRSSSTCGFTRVESDSKENSSRVYVGSVWGKENGASLKGLNGKATSKYYLDKRFGKKMAKNGELLGGVESGSLITGKVKIRVVNKGRNAVKEEVLDSVEKKVLKDFKKNGSSVEGEECKFQVNEKRSVTVLSVDRQEKGESWITTLAKRSDLDEVDLKSSLVVGSKSMKVDEEIKTKPSMVEVQPVSKIPDKVKDAKSLANGLNAEELEARLFPHHKLIRKRNLSKPTSTLVVDEKKTNNIYIELLASLSKEESKLQDMDDSVASEGEGSSFTAFKENNYAMLMADERLNEFDDEDSGAAMISEDEVEENLTSKLNGIGCKASTGGWFVSEGEYVLLAHDDGTCSFYDIANSEEKAIYNPPAGVFPNMWQDCWIIRAPNSDGLSGKYVVAASAGNSMHSGFCSWDFYTKKIHASHFEDETIHLRTALAPLSNNTNHRRLAMPTSTTTDSTQQWWYKPCGPLIMSGSSSHRTIQIFDIRDGEHVMKWELQKPLVDMDYASPLQWRSRGKVATAESDAISLWDVSSVTSRPLQSVSSSGMNITALHVNNTDAELGGGVRQRASQAEAEGHDGVFCTSDSINLLDFRLPSGIAFNIPKLGQDAHSSFSRGDSIYIGCSSIKSAAKKQYTSQIMQFSLRKQRLAGTYLLPESNAHTHFTALTQVWGNSNYVMGVCGLGLFVFDSMKDDQLPSFTTAYSNSIGPDDMYCPSFDYLSSRVLLISRDRPAMWRYFF